MTYLEQVAERANRAAPGQWAIGYNDGSGLYDEEKSEFCLVADGGICVLHARLADSYSDANFIAHARVDIPELLERITVAYQMIELSREDLLKHQPCKNWRDCATCDALARTNAALAVLRRPGPEVSSG